ncbi:hypothetical protein HI914_04508 [Erysiphe necator]|nr:hypothetical protein HI914_04508 [Erysiphe necator]
MQGPQKIWWLNMMTFRWHRKKVLHNIPLWRICRFVCVFRNELLCESSPGRFCQMETHSSGQRGLYS